MVSSSEHVRPRSLLTSICIVALCVFLWPAVVTFDPGDWPSPNQYPHHSPPANACGIVGAWCAYQLRFYVGHGAYPLLLFTTLAALIRLFRGRIDHVLGRASGLALFVTCTSASAHLLTEPAAGSLPVGHGGVIGFGLGEFFRQNLDRVGTAIVVVACLLVGLLFATEGWVLKVPGVVKRLGRASGGIAGLAKSAATATVLRPISPGQSVTAEESAALLQSDRASVRTRAARSRRQAGGAAAGQPTLFDDEGLEDRERPADESGSSVGDGYVDDDSEPAGGLSENAGAAGSGGRKKPAKKPTRPIVRFASPQQVVGEPYPRQIENWRLPSLDLLHESEYGFTDQQEQFVRKQALVLEQTLREFRLDARVVEIDTGPVITMFELKLGAGIKVSQIATLSNDIARALRAHAIRVVAPISGKNTVGIEVPNTEKEKVRLRDLMTLAGQRASDMRLPLFLGKDAGGRPLVTDLTAMPHLLIAGTTGSGKSVCLNAITLSLLMTQRPDHVKLILIDPKMVEMSQFKSVPHLMCPIVTDLVRAEKILEWAVSQMDERYELIAEARVKNVAGYNSLGADALYERVRPDSEIEKARIPTRLPYIVVVIDELADLMMTAARKVEHHLSRLAQKSRAVGVHIIVATQRPEAKIVTGLVKSNLPSRICFRVASRMDSRIVLDQNGGEVLLGQGDMLFLPPGSHKLTRAQGTFLEETEMRAVLHDLASRAKPEFHPELVRLRRPGSSGADMQRDPLFDPAVGIIVQSQRGSVSLLQRRLTIGYSRASRLIDQMAEAGIIGDYKAAQAREVLMTPGQWQALREQVATEAEEGYEADQECVEGTENIGHEGVGPGRQ